MCHSVCTVKNKKIYISVYLLPWRWILWGFIIVKVLIMSYAQYFRWIANWIKFILLPSLVLKLVIIVKLWANKYNFLSKMQFDALMQVFDEISDARTIQSDNTKRVKRFRARGLETWILFKWWSNTLTKIPIGIGSYLIDN